jgi:hypothetical protein
MTQRYEVLRIDASESVLDSFATLDAAFDDCLAKWALRRVVKAGHTLPLNVDSDGMGNGRVYDANSYAFATAHGSTAEECEARAGLICTAVNSHDALVEALKQSTTALENIRAYLAKHADRLPPMSTTGTEVQIERNRAALTAVGGTSMPAYAVRDRDTEQRWSYADIRDMRRAAERAAV